MRKSGFTLIEVMIVIAIMGALTVMTATSIQQALKSKTKIQGQIDEVSTVRDAMRLMEKDINLAFHYRDIELEMKEALKKQNNPVKTPGAVGADGSQSIGSQQDATGQDPNKSKNRVDPVTHFLGAEDKMDFVTMNFARTQKDSQQADFAIVGYSVKSCKNFRTKKATDCLWRRVNPVVGLKFDEGGTETVLLENVKEFKLRYFGKGKQDWVSTWKTDTSGDDVTKDNFPQAVEVSLTTEDSTGEKKKKVSTQMVVPIRWPNNKDKDSEAQNNTGQQQQQQQQSPVKTGP